MPSGIPNFEQFGIADHELHQGVPQVARYQAPDDAHVAHATDEPAMLDIVAKMLAATQYAQVAVFNDDNVPVATIEFNVQPLDATRLTMGIAEACDEPCDEHMLRCRIVKPSDHTATVIIACPSLSYFDAVRNIVGQTWISVLVRGYDGIAYARFYDLD